MGLFSKFKAGLAKTHSKLAHEIKRIVSRSPKLDSATLEELETALIAADLGMAVTTQIVEAVKKTYESQGTTGHGVFAIARAEVEKSVQEFLTKFFTDFQAIVVGKVPDWSLWLWSRENEAVAEALRSRTAHPTPAPPL